MNIFKKKISITFTTFLSVFFAYPVSFLFAAETPYQFLAPLPGLETFNPGSIGVPGAGDLGVYLSKVVPLFISICAVLAVVMIVLGGMQYMTSELISSKEQGKERIRNALFGLLLALGAWLLLYTINPKILDVELTSVTQQIVDVNIEDSTPQPTPPPKPNGQPGTYSCGVTQGGSLDSMGQPQNLPSWVHKNFPECTTGGQGSGCLSTRGLVLSSLNEVRNKCPGADLGLNGGTECWHHGGSHGTTHGPNSATIDLQTNTALNNCLSGGEPLVKYRRYPIPDGPYYYEGNHWHIGR